MLTQVRKTRERKIAYLDLFSGPGRYNDGKESTPLLILKIAIEDTTLREMLVTTFNDRDKDNVRKLKSAIRDLPGIEKLKYEPIVWNKEVDADMEELFASTRLVPTLFFVDPWGYKGLSLQLVNSVLKDWGSDCIFFFNYNRVSPGLNNPMVQEHMSALFGQIRAEAIREKLEGLSPEDRETYVVEELCEALGSKQGRYILPFRFRNERGSRTSHHLSFVSKHPLGYGIMKDIMASQSSSFEQGVPSFQCSPADKRFPLLFELNRPLDDLENMLLTEFASRTISMGDIYEGHHVGRRFIKKNYKDVLKLMEDKRVIRCEPSKRRKDTVGDNVMVTFPRKG